MCGIAANFAYSAEAPPIEPRELRSSLQQMAARGPDGSGIWSDPGGRIGLAHSRLAILDLSAKGAQPMQSPGRDLVIVFNGEIYNFKALRQDLQKKGYCFRSNSDTEVLLHLYADKGTEMVREIRGMFAFAIWDERKKGLFMARDPYGIKPLYYADDGGTLRVASQVKALLATGRIDKSPEAAGHIGFFLWGNVPEPFTLYKGIRALPAGHTLWVDESGRREQKPFTLLQDLLSRSTSEGKLGTGVQRSEFIHAALAESVRHHLNSDVPIGIFLSSGLDSTSLLALAAEQGSDLRTVTLGFEEFRGQVSDETVLAAKAASQFGTRHQTVWVGKSDFETHYDKMLGSMDQPSVDGVNTYFVSYAAAQAGLKVAISGLGGDELLAGYPSFSAIPRLVRSLRSVRHFPRIGSSFRNLTAPIFRGLTSPKYAGLLEYGTTWEGAYLLRRALFMPWELTELFEPEFVTEGLEQLGTLEQLRLSIVGLQSDHARLCALESCWYMRNQLLRDSDWASMAHSLELRVPLVDTRLLTQLAPLMSDEHSLSKKDMVSCLPQQLPKSICNRPKTGFGIPVRQWLIEKRLAPESGRGLRGWARLVYQKFCETAQHVPAAALAEPGMLGASAMASA